MDDYTEKFCADVFPAQRCRYEVQNKTRMRERELIKRPFNF